MASQSFSTMMPGRSAGTAAKVHSWDSSSSQAIISASATCEPEVKGLTPFTVTHSPSRRPNRVFDKLLRALPQNQLPSAERR
ncbi:hypothetical protein [Methylobacterium terricola]|uniref:hypothetical protein n=1 Tax=Methylobacterium terricola TaxID=2583531 RepID=UPI001FEC1C0B|nr:hypothetical protein [Methylobacterium terricola]